MQLAVFADHGTLAKYRAKQSGFQVKTAPAGIPQGWRPVTMRIFPIKHAARPFSTKTKYYIVRAPLRANVRNGT